MNKNASVVLIETTVFSGATLLAFLLGTHPQIATVGEMDGLIDSEDPAEYLCSCGEKIKDCGFWQAVGQAMQRRGFAFDIADFDTKFVFGGPWFIHYLRVGSFRNHTLDRGRDLIFQAWPPERRQLKTLVARNAAFIESVLEVTNKSVFIDTSKTSNRLRLVALDRFSNFDLRAIHLVRDVRGVVASQARRRDLDVSQAARRWVKWHTKLEGNLKILPPEKHIRIRYEDLCRDAPGTLEQLFRFCGVEPKIEIPDFRSSDHHIVGNPMRLKNVTEIKLDERWKDSFNSKQLNEISQVAGALRQRYGYR